MNDIIDNLSNISLNIKIHCYIIQDEFNNNLAYYMTTNYIDLYTNTLEYTLKDYFTIQCKHINVQKIIDSISNISLGYNIYINKYNIKVLQYQFEYPIEDFSKLIYSMINILNIIN
jgi:hypothetical protein